MTKEELEKYAERLQYAFKIGCENVGSDRIEFHFGVDNDKIFLICGNQENHKVFVTDVNISEEYVLMFMENNKEAML